MSRSTVIALGVLVVAAVGVAVFWPRPPPSPEDVIREKVVLMADAAGRKDLGFVMDQFSDRFHGTTGPLTKHELKQFLAAQILRGRWVRVFIRQMEPHQTSADEAAFTGKFIFGRSTADKLEDLVQRSDIEGYEVDATFEREQDGEWRIVSGSYRRIPPGTIF